MDNDLYSKLIEAPVLEEKRKEKAKRQLMREAREKERAEAIKIDYDKQAEVQASWAKSLHETHIDLN